MKPSLNALFVDKCNLYSVKKYELVTLKKCQMNEDRVRRGPCSSKVLGRDFLKTV